MFLYIAELISLLLFTIGLAGVMTSNIGIKMLISIGLFIFFISMIARASYSPFDMGESDSELVTVNDPNQ